MFITNTDEAIPLNSVGSCWLLCNVVSHVELMTCLQLPLAD